MSRGRRPQFFARGAWRIESASFCMSGWCVWTQPLKRHVEFTQLAGPVTSPKHARVSV